jgi:serine/threonine protein kinase/Tol biopolymer transport system component
VIGQTISHYKITDKLGEGGMGVVYKAEDTKLERPVALKFLAAHLLRNEEGRKRFIREAKAAAALDHPNICTVHEINEADGHTFLAMAFVTGETVKDKIGSRPLELKEALSIATQTADGLEEAHDNGIVHRDIKPENLMVNTKGQVKIMDFGLAQLAARTKLTQKGTTLGTIDYMSPEQVQGEPTDHRTDVWSLGVVLYEMVTGRLPFKGEYEQVVGYNILNIEPEPVTSLRAGLPMELEWIVGKALAKEHGERYQHVKDLLVDLRGLNKKLESGKSTPIQTGAVSRRMTEAKLGQGIQRNYRILQAALPVVLFVAVVFGWLYFSHTSEQLPLRRFAFTPEIGARNSGAPPYDLPGGVISPNGRYIAFVGANREQQIWVRDLGREQARVLEGTERVGRVFWSPDSDYLGFVTRDSASSNQSELKKVSIQDGVIQRICRFEDSIAWPAWSPDGGSIVFNSRDGSIYEVLAGGGYPEILVSSEELQRLSGESSLLNCLGLHFLPSESGARVLMYSQGTLLEGTIVAHDLDSNEWIEVRQGAVPAYSPSGHVIYQEAGDLWALPFSANTFSVTGEPFIVAENASRSSVSDDGTLVYGDPKRTLQQLVWRDRKGGKIGEIGDPHNNIFHFSLSPDERRVAFMAIEKANTDLWAYDLDRGSRDRLTDHRGIDYIHAWSPDGEELAFSSDRSSTAYDIFLGSATRLEDQRVISNSPGREVVNDWSWDGKYILYRQIAGDLTWNLRYLERGPDDAWESHPFLETRFRENGGMFSPDGRFVAYQSNQSGQNEIYVRAFPEGDREWRVSAAGGELPLRWREGELFYRASDGTLTAVPVSTQPSFTHDQPVPLFKIPPVSYDVTADGQRILVAEPVGPPQKPAIHVVQNWFAEFKDQQD